MQRVTESNKTPRSMRIEAVAIILIVGLLALEPFFKLVPVLLLICLVLTAMLLAARAAPRWKEFVLTRGFILICAAAWSFLAAELCATLYFADHSNKLETVRAYFLGQHPVSEQYMGQPYLLYVPRPGVFGPNYHNQQGYRGHAVPMQRQPGVKRVLCLGGSTTYGYSVDDPAAAYPAQLERILQLNPPPGIKGVEVINAGIPFATTAELLTHYHFKFQYFRPDVVIINTGGNDAKFTDPSISEQGQYYQPDYSHARRSFFVPPQLSLAGRVLVRSRFISWIVTLFVFGESPTRSALIRPNENDPPPTIWHPAASERGLVNTLPDADLAFSRNLNRLIDMCQADGVRVLLVPFRMAPTAEEWTSSQSERRLEQILTEIATKRDLPLAPFPASTIGPKNWADDYCHLTAAGCQEKAEYLAPFVRQLLWLELEPDRPRKSPPD